MIRLDTYTVRWTRTGAGFTVTMQRGLRKSNSLPVVQVGDFNPSYRSRGDAAGLLLWARRDALTGGATITRDTEIRP